MDVAAALDSDAVLGPTVVVDSETIVVSENKVDVVPSPEAEPLESQVVLDSKVVALDSGIAVLSSDVPALDSEEPLDSRVLVPQTVLGSEEVVLDSVTIVKSEVVELRSEKTPVVDMESVSVESVGPSLSQETEVQEVVISSVDVVSSLVAVDVLVVDSSSVVVELTNEAVNVDSAEDSVIEPETLPVAVVDTSEVTEATEVVAQGSGRFSTLNIRAVQPSRMVGPWRKRPESRSQT